MDGDAGSRASFLLSPPSLHHQLAALIDRRHVCRLPVHHVLCCTVLLAGSLQPAHATHHPLPLGFIWIFFFLLFLPEED
jgi:hypothetical protein